MFSMPGQGPPPLVFRAGILVEPGAIRYVQRSGIMFAPMRGLRQLGLFPSEAEAWRVLVIDARQAGMIVAPAVLGEIKTWIERGDGRG
jgi:hypothetical protein